jgi:hypothetical protein
MRRGGGEILRPTYMKEKLLSYDPLTGLTEWHSYDESTDTTYIRIEGDCEPTLEQNKMLANDTDITKQGIKEGFWLYASIPPAFQVKLLIEKGIDVYKKSDAARLSKVLEDPEYRHLKTTSRHHRFK